MRRNLGEPLPANNPATGKQKPPKQNASPNPFGWVGRDLTSIGKFLLHVLFVGCAFATLGSYLGDQQHALELLTHFRMQILALSCISGLGVILCYGRIWILLALIMVALNALPVVPYYIPHRATATNTPSIRLLNANVLISNTHYEPLAQLIQKEAPDIVALQEVDATWLNVLEPTMHGQYPYRKLVPVDSPFGIALYSKFPLSGVQVKFFGKAYRGRFFPSILAQVQCGAKCGPTGFGILVTHPLPPKAGFEVRNSQLADIAQQRASFGPKLIITGDLNISQWSPYFSQFIHDTGLQDSQLGFGVQPSWPADMPLFRVPIDHVLISPGIEVIHRRLGPDIGSDHLPVIVDLQIL